MGLDLRIPLGLLFVLVGFILLGYGALTLGSPMYVRSMGENVNIKWGAILTIFGALVLLLAWRARTHVPAHNTSAASVSQRQH